MYKKELGDYGEYLAIQFLKTNGYEIISRNFFSRFGEIDIIAKDGDEYVFIEVKTRTNKQYGVPADAVDTYKRKHIVSASRYFIYKYNIANKYIRFDVIEVKINRKKIDINHIKNVFL